MSVSNIRITDCAVRLSSGGMHYFDRRSGLNLLDDSVKIEAERQSMAPMFVSIALTNACNLSCLHCFAPKKEAMVQCERCIYWIDDLAENGCLGVGFGGGEPLLHPDFEKLSTYVHDKTKMACTVTSNGTLWTDDLIERLDGKVDFLRISTNGNALPVELIQKLAIRFNVGINYLLTDVTFGQLESTIKEAALLGVQEVLILPVIGTGRVMPMNQKRIMELDCWLRSFPSPIRLTVSENGAENLTAVTAIPGESGLRQYAHIAADGVLKRSSFMADGIIIGDKTISDILKEKEQP